MFKDGLKKKILINVYGVENKSGPPMTLLRLQREEDCREQTFIGRAETLTFDTFPHSASYHNI